MKIKKFFVVAVVVMAALALSSCLTTGGNKQIVGTFAGAGLGALAGSQFGGGTGQLAAVAIGALGGAFLGGEIGASMDKVDEMRARQATATALEGSPTNTGVGWQNPDSGHSGMVMPTRTYQSADGRYCREYRHKVILGDKQEQGVGTACRNPDGTWQLVN